MLRWLREKILSKKKQVLIWKRATIFLFAVFVYASGDRLDTNGNPIKAMNDTQKDIIIYILGVLSAAITQVLGYYFGSSKGSDDKSKSISEILIKK
jgi:hypothetical protein